MINSALTLKVSRRLKLLTFTDVSKYWWCQNKIPQVKICTPNYLEHKNNREAQKLGIHGGTPQNFWHCETKLYFTSKISIAETKLRSLAPPPPPPHTHTHTHKIFGVLENFKFQNGEFLQS